MMEKDVKQIVRDNYGSIAQNRGSCCSPQSNCECGSPVQEYSKEIGYSNEDVIGVPDGANLGLGCGNPIALAFLKEGETVLDLGSGAGFDCFLAAKKVGENGKVIGVDMTPEMVEKATRNAQMGNFKNVEFRLGDIEELPVADNSIDSIISNCVINLAPDKGKVFKEAFRVLRQEGKLMVSDMVLLKELPEAIRNSVDAYVGCLGGAIMKDEYINAMKQAGFQDIKIVGEAFLPMELLTNDPMVKGIIENLKMPPEMVREVSHSIASIKVRGIK
jgi:arsenite methyltransferase